MTRKEDLANADRRLPASGRLSEEDLEGVTGGLMRPPQPGRHENHRIGGGTDAGHDDDADA